MGKLSPDQVELRKMRKHLRALVAATSQAITAIDQLGSDRAMLLDPLQRGQALAAVANHLEMHRDMAARYGLGFSWRKSGKSVPRG